MPRTSSVAARGASARALRGAQRVSKSRSRRGGGKAERGRYVRVDDGESAVRRSADPRRIRAGARQRTRERVRERVNERVAAGKSKNKAGYKGASARRDKRLGRSGVASPYEASDVYEGRRGGGARAEGHRAAGANRGRVVSASRRGRAHVERVRSSRRSEPTERLARRRRVERRRAGGAKVRRGKAGLASHKRNRQRRGSRHSGLSLRSRPSHAAMMGEQGSMRRGVQKHTQHGFHVGMNRHSRDAARAETKRATQEMSKAVWEMRKEVNEYLGTHPFVADRAIEDAHRGLARRALRAFTGGADALVRRALDPEEPGWRRGCAMVAGVGGGLALVGGLLYMGLVLVGGTAGAVLAAVGYLLVIAVSVLFNRAMHGRTAYLHKKWRHRTRRWVAQQRSQLDVRLDKILYNDEDQTVTQVFSPPRRLTAGEAHYLRKLEHQLEKGIELINKASVDKLHMRKPAAPLQRHLRRLQEAWGHEPPADLSSVSSLSDSFDRDTKKRWRMELYSSSGAETSDDESYDDRRAEFELSELSAFTRDGRDDGEESSYGQFVVEAYEHAPDWELVRYGLDDGGYSDPYDTVNAWPAGIVPSDATETSAESSSDDGGSTTVFAGRSTTAGITTSDDDDYDEGADDTSYDS